MTPKGAKNAIYIVNIRKRPKYAIYVVPTPIWQKYTLCYKNSMVLTQNGLICVIYGVPTQNVRKFAIIIQ